MSLGCLASALICFSAKKINKMVILTFIMFNIELIFLKILLPPVASFVFRGTGELIKNISFHISVVVLTKKRTGRIKKWNLAKLRFKANNSFSLL